ncbi:MAG: MFS transporter [Burkholderiaceae bacterium]|nr:MFS transporter [Burkholderiaceae bacterium]
MQYQKGLSQPKFFGPWAVRSAFVLAVFGWGVGFYGPSIYLAEVIGRTGWTLGLVSLAVTLHFLFGAIVIANLPRVYARVGLPVTTVAGAVVTTLGLLGWATASHPWQLFVAALATGAGWVTMGAVAVNAIVSPWYTRERPSALSKAYNGASLGGVIFSPLWVALIAQLGFAGAAAAVGISITLVALLLGRYAFAKTPEALGQSPDGDAAPEAKARSADRPRLELPGVLLWRDRAFITLAAGMAIGLFAQIGLLAHLFTVLMPTLGAQSAGFLLGGATACAIAGRYVAARALSLIGERRVVAAGSYVIQALGVLALLSAKADQTWLIVLGVLLFGSGIGNATSIPPLVAQTDFAAKDVSRVVALIVAIGQGTYAFAPAFFGVLQSAANAGQATSIGSSSYLFFATVIAIQVGAAAVFLLGLRRT